MEKPFEYNWKDWAIGIGSTIGVGVLSGGTSTLITAGILFKSALAGMLTLTADTV